MSAFPPAGPTGLTKTTPSYLYYQYNDDTALQQLVDGYNALTQAYVDWFNNARLPIYTGLAGDLLDWVAAGLYGIFRPTFTTGTSNSYGSYDTVAYDVIPYGHRQVIGAARFVQITDDIFKRVITWNFYKADGFQFSMSWLKRRVHRWLNGANGVAPAIQDNTYDVSVSLGSNRSINIILASSQPASMLQLAMSNGVLAVPVQYTVKVVLMTRSQALSGGLRARGRTATVRTT